MVSALSIEKFAIIGTRYGFIPELVGALTCNIDVAQPNGNISDSLGLNDTSNGTNCLEIRDTRGLRFVFGHHQLQIFFIPRSQFYMVR